MTHGTKPAEGPKGRVEVVPLGGLGEIGMNCLVLRHHSGGDVEQIMVDCGVTFPDDDYGVDVIHPSFDPLLTGDGRLTAVALTHGHEDHVGGLPHLARALTAAGRAMPPVFGPPHAVALARRRWSEQRDLPEVRFEEVEAGGHFDVGPFSVESARVTHSIPQATALRITTPAGRVVHSGDFKLDPEPLDHQPTDAARLTAWGDEGVDVLLSDSTNALTDGHTTSERVVADALAEAIADAPGRVVVGLFASNVLRLDAVAQATWRSGRHLCLLGRSVRNHAEVGRAIGILRWASDLVVRVEAAAKLPRDKVLYVASGTQGEARGALRRIASGAFSGVKLDAGDRVLLSSRIIPGHERVVFDLIDDLTAAGLEVRTRATHPAIHCSGHGRREELAQMLAWIRPRWFVPVHGTRLHMQRHAELGLAQGAEVVLLENGAVARLSASGFVRAGRVESGRVAVRGTTAVDEDTLRARRELGRKGLITVAVRRGEEPRIVVRCFGVPREDEVARAAEIAVRAGLGGNRDPQLRGLEEPEALRRLVRWRVAEVLGFRPGVDVTLMD